MRGLIFACKRTLRNLSFMLMLAACVGAIFAASLEGSAGTLPPAGVYCGDDSPAAQRIVSYLTENGFVRCENEEELRRQVESGALDCGAVLPEGLSYLIEAGETEGCIAFLESPLSFSPRLYQSHVAAAVYRECAPYIAAHVLRDLPQQELLEEYEQRFLGGYVFTFDILSSEGAARQTEEIPPLIMGAVALLIFALLSGAGAEVISREMLLRLGAGRALGAVILPGTLVRGLFAAAAGSAALLIAGAAQLILPLTAYILVLSGWALLVTALLPEPRDRGVLLVVTLLASLALCPIFVDLTLFSPLLRWVRGLMPPYWFYLAVEHRGIWLVIGCVALLLGSGAVYARWYLRERIALTGNDRKTGGTGA